MAAGPFIFAAAALALAAAARSRKRSGGVNLTNTLLDRVRVDQSLLNVNPAAALTTALAKRTQDDQRILKTSSSIVGSILQATLSIATAATGVGILELAYTVLTTIMADATLAALSIVAIVIAIFVVVGNIVGRLKNESLRIKTAIAATGGTFYTVNTWEWKSASAWLTQMKIPFKTVDGIKDTRLDTTFYDDSGVKYTSHHDRVAIVPTLASATSPGFGITSADWLQLQLLIRCASLDYFTRVGRMLNFVGVNLKSPAIPYGAEAPPYIPVPQGAPPAPDPKAYAGSYFEKNVLPAVWADLQLVGDATSHDESNINDPLAKGVVAAQAGAYSDVKSQFAATRTWAQVALNNHFMAILGALSVYKVDPRSVDWGVPSQVAQYTAHIYWGAGLRPEYDHCYPEGGVIKFSAEYYGLFTVLDVRAFKTGGGGAITMIGVDAQGRPVEAKSSF